MSEYQFINLWQTNEERQQKYYLLRSLGINPYHAQRMRDWRLSKIERLFNLPTTNKQLPLSDRIHAQLSIPGLQPTRADYLNSPYNQNLRL